MTSNDFDNEDWAETFKRFYSLSTLQQERKYLLILSEVNSLLAKIEFSLKGLDNPTNRLILLTLAASTAGHGCMAASGLGDFETALRYAERDIAFSKESGRHDFGLARGLHNRGYVNYDLGHLAQAEEDFLAALAIIDDDSSPRSLELRYFIHNHLAQIYVTREEKEQAQINLYKSSLFQKLASVQSPVGGLDMQSATTLINESVIALEEGAFNKAAQLLEQAFVLAREKRLGPNLQGIIACNLGIVYSEQQQWDRAIEYLELAVHIHKDEPGCQEPLARDLYNLALIYYRTSRHEQGVKTFKEAWDAIRQINPHSVVALNILRHLGLYRFLENDMRRARAAFEKGLELYEEMRPRIAQTEVGQEGIFETYRALVEAMQHLSLEEGWVDEVLLLTERAKARFWREQMDLLEDQNPPVQEKSLTELVSTPTEPAKLGMRSDFVSANDAVENLIGHNVLVLNYFTGPNATFLNCLFNRTINCRGSQTSEKELFELTQAFINDLMSSSRRAQYSENGLRLSELLLGKITLELSDIKHIVVMPDGPLWYVPFDALPLPKKMRGRNGRTFLGDMGPVSYLPSLTLLRDLSLKEDDDLDKNNWRFLVVAQPETSPDFSPLKGTMEEFLELQERVAPNNIILLKGNDATKVNFISYIQNKTHIHLGSHALADLANASPGIVFSTVKDDFLFANEIMSQRINADLVFLSACSTSIGKNSTGEGLMSIARAFLLAGCRCVVATLWPISDEEASSFVCKFYRHLFSGTTITTALQRAKLEFKRDGGSIRTWAAFQAIGCADNPSKRFSPPIQV